MCFLRRVGNDVAIFGTKLSQLARTLYFICTGAFLNFEQAIEICDC